MHAALDESHRTRDQLLLRNKQLEADMKGLKRDFNRKVAEVVSGQRSNRNGPSFSHVSPLLWHVVVVVVVVVLVVVVVVLVVVVVVVVVVFVVGESKDLF